MQSVARIIEERLDQKPLIVLSALGGVTDQLIEAHQRILSREDNKAEQILKALYNRHKNIIDELISDPMLYDEISTYMNAEFQKVRTFLNATRAIKVESPEIYSSLLSTGELLSTHIFNSYLRCKGIQSICQDIRPIMIIDTKSSGIIPLMQDISREVQIHWQHHIEQEDLIVTQGFLATTRNGAPTTLGRDGSDYTASILGAVLKVREIQIWSDVDGILSADPSIVTGAHPLPFMTFEEACELAYFGARVLHPATIQPALDHGIPVRVLNSHHPQEKGTLILPDYKDTGQKLIKSIAYKENILLVIIESSDLLLSPKLIEEIFQIFTDHGKKVYAITKSATKLSVTIQNNSDSYAFIDELKQFGTVHLEPGKVVVSVVGEGMKGNLELTWQIIRMLHQNAIKLELISQFANQISMMFIIGEEDIEKTVKMIHTEFIETKEF